LGWFLYSLVKQKPDRSRIALTLWLLVPLIFFSFAASKGARYVMISAPAAFIVVALFWWHVRDRWMTVRRWRFASILVLVLLVGLPVRFCMERVKPVGGPDWHAEWAQSFRKIGAQFEGTRTVVFNVQRPIELMFYSSVVAYSKIPTDEDIHVCNAKGYDVVVFDSADLPEWIRTHTDVTVLPEP
jgi:4-amino-4-deoxy-L-arabinose transferase